MRLPATILADLPAKGGEVHVEISAYSGLPDITVMWGSYMQSFNDLGLRGHLIISLKGGLAPVRDKALLGGLEVVHCDKLAISAKQDRGDRFRSAAMAFGVESIFLIFFCFGLFRGGAVFIAFSFNIPDRPVAIIR